MTTEQQATPTTLPEIEKGIPVQREKHNVKGSFNFLISGMEVDDSIFFSDAKYDLKKVRHNIYQAAFRNKIKMMIRKVEGGIRAWRIR